ncbi:hypothetical protein NHH73_15835 [Oxalobacteraceae bacterium OTU3CINTB1]|nr:hypothetical protein NHH73_15835 [Oxalobacteraceae bacterium OTU3CINTB1]
MDEIVFNLLLNSVSGSSLSGTLSYRFSELDTVKSGEVSSLVQQALTQQTMELTVYRVDGTLSVPELTGSSAVSISGISLVSQLGPPVVTIFSGTDQSSNLGLQFNGIDSAFSHIGGGLLWRSGEQQQEFSVLGTRPASGL